jgi:16S rRNA (adenine1518-N6/adenine1519-N6)-dimethyltransferase
MRWSRSALAALFRERGIHPKRFLGQNFLVDDQFLDAIVRDAGVCPEDGVVEIGSGIGNLTERLADRAGHVWAFEIDPALHEISVERLGPRENVTLINLDGVEFNGHIDPGVYRTLRIVSNLPYSDWQRILLRLLSTRHEVASYTVMLQRDVYVRLRARPGTKDYGPMPALLQATCEAKALRRAGRSLFYPAPRVDSVVVEIRRRRGALDYERVESRLRRLFAQRRKKSAAAGGRRVEELPADELLGLCLDSAFEKASRAFTPLSPK